MYAVFCLSPRWNNLFTNKNIVLCHWVDYVTTRRYAEIRSKVARWYTICWLNTAIILHRCTSCVMKGCSRKLWDSHKKQTTHPPTQTHTNHRSGSVGGGVAGASDTLATRRRNLQRRPWLYLNGTQPDTHSWLDWNQLLCGADSDKYLFLKLLFFPHHHLCLDSI